jgi:5-methylthioadenosine/S-adenosylhomocysteine deaminase
MLLLRARWIVPVEPAGAVLEHHAVAVRDGRIEAVVPWSETAKFAGYEEVDLAEHALVPGLINCHTRAASVLRRGLGDDLEDGPHLTPRSVREGARLACEEMLRGGITCFADAFYFPEATIEAAAAAGLRCAQGILVSEATSGYASDAADYLSKGLAARDRHRDAPRLTFHLAPHAVSHATLRQVATLAAELDLPVQVAAEPGAIERLGGMGLLEPGVIITGAAALGDDEIARLGRHGCSVVHCPSADLKQGLGMARMDSLARAHVNVALGTRGAASNHRVDLFHEMSISRLPAQAALQAATLGGARALGIDPVVGSITPGKAADLVAIAFRGPDLAPCPDPVALLVYSAGRQHVTHVWVDGQALVAP